MHVFLATWEAEIRSIEVKGQPGQKLCATPSPKLTTEKWNGGVAQVVELLFCKHEALSSISSAIKKNKIKYDKSKTIHDNNIQQIWHTREIST
jgi:hypothetical protein